MGKLGNALILSPFATHPLDAGQRKRAFQTTSLLKEWGFTITFLHFAFESRWYWGHNSEDDAVIKEQWEGDVLHFYANKKVGLPPENGESHQLDEWWDESLGGYINNIFSKRQYDLFVVHNIWLSKAFDYVPYHCLKVLEMHDLFSQRAREFEATGVPPEFFHCSEKDEVFGLQRADLLFAIKQEDSDWCKKRELGKTQVITIPYVEQSGLRRAKTNPATDVKPINPGKVVFGMIGSDIHFNRHAVHAIIKELEVVIRETYAPIEFVLAGTICRSVGECPVFVTKLGFVDRVADFYSAVDVAIVPMLHGTGVKIKSVEALSYLKPVLFTTHSAEGTGYGGTTCVSLFQMAQWASRISLCGEIPANLVRETYSAIQTSQEWIVDAGLSFHQLYLRKRPSFVFVIGSCYRDKHQQLAELVASLLLFKHLKSAYRCNALAIHPCLLEYIPSIPSDILPFVQSLGFLRKALQEAQLVITSYSQLHLIIQMTDNMSHSPIVLVDLRAIPNQDYIQDSFDSTIPDYMNLFFIIGPVQAATLPKEHLARAVVIPLLDSRVTWDPHIKPNLNYVLQGVHSSKGPLWLSVNCADGGSMDLEDPQETMRVLQLSNNDIATQEGLDLINNLLTQ